MELELYEDAQQKEAHREEVLQLLSAVADNYDAQDDDCEAWASFVVEAPELGSLFQQWSALYETSQEQSEGQEDVIKPIYKRIDIILKKYQEKPQLLDPHIRDIVSPLVAIARHHRDKVLAALAAPAVLTTTTTAVTPSEHKIAQRTFKLIYLLAKVRGHKIIMRLFPHEVSDIQPTILYLDQVCSSPDALWQARYVVLLWLSVILLIPFSLSLIIATNSSRDSQRSMLDKMIDTCEAYLGDTGKTREAAAELLSRLLTRPDIEMQQRLTVHLQWARLVLLSTDSDNSGEGDGGFLKTGILATLALVFKRGQREALIDKAAALLAIVTRVLPTHGGGGGGGSIVLRKLCVKLTQRLGLTFLRPVVPKWRYQKGNRSLLSNMETAVIAGQVAADVGQQQDTNQEYDIPAELEDVIEILLTGLRDKDTIVRWSAAKGIGRVAERLPVELAGDVVQSVLELLSETETDSSWHGGCLALAELARRGLLLSLNLDRVIPLIIQALTYDVRKGVHSVGTHVRDAACYVCWAFGRAYAPEIMAPYVTQLAPALIVTAVFDREVNCRRAASAAFQENVGRQGQFPNGIDIIQLADYFALSNRVESYTNISTAIALLSYLYKQPMIDHLAYVKLIHWDTSIRTLAAKALGNFVPLRTDYIAEVILPKLVALAVDPHEEIITRHGSLVGISEIIVALAHQNYFTSQNRTILVESVTSVIPELDKNRLYKGRGTEKIREAASQLIESIARSHLPIANTAVPPTQLVNATTGRPRGGLQAMRDRRNQARGYRQVYVETMDEILKHPNESVSASAVSAFKAYTAEYFEGASVSTIAAFVNKYVAAITTLSGTTNVALRRGYTPALGSVPGFFVNNHNRGISTDSNPHDTTESKKEKEQEQEKAETEALADTSAVAAISSSITDVLILNAAIETDKSAADPESRRNATQALEQLADTFDDNNVLVHGRKIYEALLKASDDYSIDNRGDVGSWVRNAALAALYKWTLRICFAQHRQQSQQSQQQQQALPDGAPILTSELAQRFMSRLLRILGEKLDRLRQKAGHTLESILYPTAGQPSGEDAAMIKQYFHPLLAGSWDALVTAFPKNAVANWAVSSDTFPRLVTLLRVGIYAEDVLTGIATAIGGVTRSISDDASNSLISELRTVAMEEGGKPPLTGTFVAISRAFSMVFKNNLHNDRITVPLMKTLQLVLYAQCFMPLQPPDYNWSKNTLILVRAEIRQTNDVVKLRTAAAALGGLLTFNEPTRHDALELLFALLGHRFPKVRSAAAEQLYTALLTFEHLGIAPSQHTAVIVDILTTTPWETTWAAIKNKHEILCTAFDISTGVKK
eukprot:TRINITY_DN9952_c0_g1_i1.p1 TRINITY_DN9952_c0_g1~~TRINITY_DN9952_c0_g1_i1.p1  ORF type:complete len:1366 (-),score=225.40 TRINITY_DN9952_c0_g1_i1:17-4012(-)